MGHFFILHVNRLTVVIYGVCWQIVELRHGIIGMV
jgi:hypothetical protein